MKRLRLFVLTVLDIIGGVIECIVTHSCGNCEGTGTVAIGNEHALCPVCGGQGRV